ncbi:unnamed protein product [Paramecium sonneborni]|uniref:Uncharacterized protein n=1 Tax=Paramecium sonneborni TaxID=65129 RepID=A0A8S1NSU1_9CILI|nr:unnamed protein product [Paramecium sonneborni]
MAYLENQLVDKTFGELKISLKLNRQFLLSVMLSNSSFQSLQLLFYTITFSTINKTNSIRIQAQQKNKKEEQIVDSQILVQTQLIIIIGAINIRQLFINLHKSIFHNGEEKYQKDIQLKNDQIVMLQNENNQLVKLIENLKHQQINNQGKEQIKVKQLESELKNLQSFIYDSPLVVLFNLLEDRLSKQQQKSFENKGKIKEFWSTQLKQWIEGFEELKQAFSGLKILFKYDLKYANQTSQQND